MKKPYTILSLDLGTTFGWAFVQAGVMQYSGEVTLPGPKEHPGLRFLTFQNWLADFRGVNEIFYEAVPRFESAKSAMVYCGLLSILQVFVVTHGMRMTSIKSNSVKKEFTGNGNSDKKAMCKTCHKIGWQNGHPDTDIAHNEADAIACAWVILQRRGVEMQMPEFKPAQQQEAI